MFNFLGLSGFRSPVHLEELLSKEGTTVSEAIDDDLFIQELKNKNPKVLAFLDNEKIKELIDIMSIENHDEECDRKKRYKHPLVAADALASEADIILDFFFPKAPEEGVENDHEEKIEEVKNIEEIDYQHLNYLLSFLTQIQTNSVNLTSISYICKVLGSFISKKTAQFIEYLMKENKISIIKHFILSKSIADIICRIICLDVNLSGYLVSKTFVKERIELLDWVIDSMFKAQEFEEAINCGYIVAEVFCRQGTSEQKDMIKYLFTCDVLDKLFIGLGNKSMDIFNATFSVLDEMIKYLFAESASETPDPLLSSWNEAFFSTYIKHFDIIESLLDGQTESFIDTMGTEEKKVGHKRLKCITLLIAGIKSERVEILTKFAVNNIPGKVFDLFLKFSLNNMFHNIAIKFIITCLESSSHCIKVKGIVEQCGIAAKLLNESKKYIILKQSNSKLRSGNIGHIVALAQMIKKIAEKDSDVNLITQTREWIEFNQIFLKKAIEKENADLGGMNLHEEDNSTPYDNSHFSKDDIISSNQAFLNKEDCLNTQVPVKTGDDNEEVEEEIDYEEDKDKDEMQDIVDKEAGLNQNESDSPVRSRNSWIPASKNDSEKENFESIEKTHSEEDGHNKNHHSEFEKNHKNNENSEIITEELIESISDVYEGEAKYWKLNSDHKVEDLLKEING